MSINYVVKRIDTLTAKQYICQNHYSHGCHNGPSPCYGLFDNNQLIGVLMFATPCSENVRSSLFGEQHKNGVVELHRLHILDGTPRNTESYFIGKCLRLLIKDRPQTLGVISFADATEGHKGIIYQATNFLYCGTTGKTRFYIDKEGRLRHPRQNGINISLTKATQLGWTPTIREGKYRYVYLLSKNAKKLFRLTKLPFPKN